MRISYGKTFLNGNISFAFNNASDISGHGGKPVGVLGRGGTGDRPHVNSISRRVVIFIRDRDPLYIHGHTWPGADVANVSHDVL